MWGFSWSLCLFQSGTDTGLTFTIKLLKEPIHVKSPVPIGANPVLVPQEQLPQKPDPPLFTKSVHTSTSGTSFAPIANPLLSTQTKNLKLTIVNLIFLILNATSPDLVNDCWLCYHSQPPFYECFAIPGNFNPTNNSHHCRWQTEEWNGLSLSRVSRLGLCETSNTPPSQYSHLCNVTLHLILRATIWFNQMIPGGFALMASPLDSQLALLFLQKIPIFEFLYNLFFNWFIIIQKSFFICGIRLIIPPLHCFASEVNPQLRLPFQSS